LKIIDVREISVPITAGGANAVVNFEGHTVSFVAVISDRIRQGKPVSGVAFNSIGRFAQSGILRERMIPRLLKANPETLQDEAGCLDPARVLACILAGEKPGGHGDRASAAAAIELAIWDLNAKLREEPAAQTLARTAGTQLATKRVPVYAAGGYYPPPGSEARLTEELRRYADQGYRHFKIKIGGLTLSEDIGRVQEAISVAGGGQYVAVDANGRFDIDTALTFGAALEPLGLRWYEEPGDPLDYALNKRLCEHYHGPVATGENLFSTADVRNLLRYGGLRPDRDIVQMDPGLSYGVTEYLSMLVALEAAGFSRTQCIPHGGHLINLHVVAGLGLGGCEAYPQVFQPVGGFDEATSVTNGQITLSDAPGFGLEQKRGLTPILEQLLNDSNVGLRQRHRR
jgi:L-alanine-DL-glutamate epimerase-like enolase superfamily enzyme